jgi:hypothetical protein
MLTSCGGSGSRAGESLEDCPPRELSGTGTRTTLPASDEALAATVAETFCSTWVITSPDGKTTLLPVVTSEEGRCIGDGLVDGLQASRIRELSLLGRPWHLLGFALSNNGPSGGITRAEAERIVDTFKDCAQTWKLLLIKSVTQGADAISDESARCVRARLADGDARTILVGEIDRAYDDPSQKDAVPYPVLVKPLVAAFDSCLTPAELARMDWN